MAGRLACGLRLQKRSTLDELPNKQIALLVSFNPPAPTPPNLAAFLLFDDVGSCPPFDLAVDLDGVPLDISTAAIVTDGQTCTLGYFVIEWPFPAGTIVDDAGLDVELDRPPRLVDVLGPAFVGGKTTPARLRPAGSVTDAFCVDVPVTVKQVRSRSLSNDLTNR